MAKAKKSSSLKARPSVGALRGKMTKLRDDLTVIIDKKKDKKGTLDTRQLKDAKKAKKGLDKALVEVRCVQGHSPY